MSLSKLWVYVMTMACDNCCREYDEAEPSCPFCGFGYGEEEEEIIGLWNNDE